MSCKECSCGGFKDGSHCLDLGCIMHLELTPVEVELLELLKLGSMTFNDLSKLNPRFLGVLGRLKAKRLIEVVHLPNKDKRALWMGK